MPAPNQASEGRYATANRRDGNQRSAERMRSDFCPASQKTLFIIVTHLHMQAALLARPLAVGQPRAASACSAPLQLGSGAIRDK